MTREALPDASLVQAKEASFFAHEKSGSPVRGAAGKDRKTSDEKPPGKGPDSTDRGTAAHGGEAMAPD
ncbi:hypothetical protein HHA02_23590 [Cobetia marina]|nr:hypothetical protein HHA02_23590 [Cobetia marina]